MKIKFIQMNIQPKGEHFDECKNCKMLIYSKLYQLDGWTASDWLCGNCFLDELINSEANYNIIHERDLK